MVDRTNDQSTGVQPQEGLLHDVDPSLTEANEVAKALDVDTNTGLSSAEAQRRGGYEFDIPFSRQQLADYLGVERSGLSLELGKSGMRACSTFIKATFFSRRQRRMVFLLLRVKNLPFKPPLGVLESADSPGRMLGFYRRRAQLRTCRD